MDTLLVPPELIANVVLIASVLIIVQFFIKNIFGIIDSYNLKKDKTAFLKMLDDYQEKEFSQELNKLDEMWAKKAAKKTTKKVITKVD